MAADAGSARLMAPAHAFGLATDVQNNVIAVDETTVCYPVGRAIVLFNTDTRKMAFVREGTQEKSDVTALAISPTKKYLAVCERAEHAQVAVYHVASQRRTKTLPQGTPPHLLPVLCTISVTQFTYCTTSCSRIKLSTSTLKV